MPTRRHVRTDRSLSRYFVPIGVLLLLGVGVTGTLWGMGFFESRAEAISREGQIAYPALARPVRAFDAITRDDLLDPRTGQVNVIWLPEDQKNTAMLRDLSKILGRVVSRDKLAGYVLTEADLLPVGTRPGIAAGIPPGKRSITIPVEEVPGLELLHKGDSFDLLAVLPKQEQEVSNIEEAALLGGVKPPDTRSGQLARQTGIKPLVVGGTMVAITQGKNRSTDGAEGLVVSTEQNKKDKEPQKYATIAVEPVEVTPLTEAIGLELDLFCVARSGHPDESIEKVDAASFEGLVPVVTLSQSVDAYSAINQEDLADSVTGRLNIYYFPPEKVEENWLTDYSALNGRVPAKNLSRGSVVRENDLLPPGTRPGVSGAVPAGMVALSVPSDAIEGLQQMRTGDTFEIHSQLAGDYQTKPTFASVNGGRLPSSDQLLQTELETGIRILSEQAKLLTVQSGEDHDLLSIAVAEDDVLQVMKSLKSKQKMFVVATSQEKGESQTNLPKRPTARVKHEHEEPQSASQINPIHIRLAVQSGEAVADNPSERITVPVLVKAVNSRERLTVDHFYDPATQKIRYIEFNKEQLPDDVVDDLGQLLGKRTGRELMAGTWVLANDISKVQVPSIPNDIPAGWSVIEVTSQEVRGLRVVEVGDRIDLVASRPVHSIDTQSKAEWPMRGSAATFYNVAREDLFTQADVSPLTEQAIVVLKEQQELEIPVSVSEEVATAETQMGDATEREGVTRKERTEFHQKLITVCHVAVPLDAVPMLVEAMAVQSIMDPNLSQNDNGSSNQSTKENETLDNEVAIYAVLRNPSTPTEVKIPKRDIVSSWMRRWGSNFSKFMNEFEPQAKQVQPVQHIRGNEVTHEYWKAGQSYQEFPAEAVKNDTIRSLINQRGEE